MGWGTWGTLGSWVSSQHFHQTVQWEHQRRVLWKENTGEMCQQDQSFPPEGIKHQDYIYLGLWRWPKKLSTTIMYPDSSKHPTFSLLYGISDHSSCSNDTPKMTEASWMVLSTWIDKCFTICIYLPLSTASPAPGVMYQVNPTRKIK